MPPAQSGRLYEAAPGPKRFVLIARADHNDYELLAGQQYRWPDEDYTVYVPRQLYRDLYKQATRRLASSSAWRSSRVAGSTCEATAGKNERAETGAVLSMAIL